MKGALFFSKVFTRSLVHLGEEINVAQFSFKQFPGFLPLTVLLLGDNAQVLRQEQGADER